jgi:SP family myo-inositol transporter-like MFS transporter 13
LNRQRLANSHSWCRSPQVSSIKLANGRAGLIKSSNWWYAFRLRTGIISAVLVYIGKDPEHTLSSNEKELITSITSGAAFFGAIFAGTTADKFGRKPAIYVGCVLFIISATLQAASFGPAQMTVGRLVVGFGVGSAAMIANVSPAKYRGRMIGLDNMSITGGQLVSYDVGAAFAHVRGRRCAFVPNE